jgi:DNA-binding CsgD family transcriptional regulator
VPLHARGLAPHWLVLVPAVCPRDRVHAQLAAAATRWSLTPRETEVASWIVRGATNQRIAAELGCAEHTVEVHVTRILAKSDLTSRAELVAKILT